MTEGATIMLVDDHAIVREGYRSLLQKQPRLKVVAEAGDGAEAYRLFKATRPDLVIMGREPTRPIARSAESAAGPLKNRRRERPARLTVASPP